MIRLNAFFTLKEGASINDVLAITADLVAQSRLDEGNKGYDLFQSTTDPRVFMFCETWESQEALDKHSAASHFTNAVPALGGLTADGLHIERFER
ncbi:MAG: antibiotic biosynthesis monooxygenase [Bacteroidales bacterium]|nr:antibiotic biosynthesis monooxygenase [Bacteroidales bacterium]